MQLQPGVISAANFHTCAIDNNGEVHCWGDGAQALGPIPKPPAGIKFTYIATTSTLFRYGKKDLSGHICGVLSNAQMMCW